MAEVEPTPLNVFHLKQNLLKLAIELPFCPEQGNNRSLKGDYAVGDENKWDWDSVYGVAALMTLIFIGLSIIDFIIASSTPYR